MIFVTVGTHEQQFDRLVSFIDNLKCENFIQDDVVIQTGYSTYLPRQCIYRDWFSYDEMLLHISEAQIVITHGGPSSFITPLQLKKIPIVVPRQKKFGEHVNNHQMVFAEEFSKRYKNIIPVFDIAELKSILANYDKIAGSMSTEMISNNINFNRSFEKVVYDLCKRR